MRRRAFIAIAGGTAGWPLAARGQQSSSVPRIGVVFTDPKAEGSLGLQAVRDGLRAGGYSKVEFVSRAGYGESSRSIPLLMEIIASKVDVLVAQGPAQVQAARSATQTLPIIAFDLESDPVDTGWAASLSHPGGNITGIFMAFPEFAAKWLGLLQETLPRLSHVAVLWDPSTGSFQKKSIEAAAKASDLTLETMEVRVPSEFDGAFDSAKRGGADALIMLSSPLIGYVANERKEAELAILHKLPTIGMFTEFAQAGGLMAYGPDILDAYREQGGMVAKVLHGRKPADLPIQRPTKFELVINVKAAKALGLTLPPTLLARATEVIE
jgi:putative ABC transport system substrate-binding protein